MRQLQETLLSTRKLSQKKRPENRSLESWGHRIRVYFKRNHRRVYAPILQDLRVHFACYANRLLSDDDFRLPSFYEAFVFRRPQLVFDPEHPQKCVNSRRDVFVSYGRVRHSCGELRLAFWLPVKRGAFAKFKHFMRGFQD